jgi:hypothetical protein
MQADHRRFIAGLKVAFDRMPDILAKLIEAVSLSKDRMIERSRGVTTLVGLLH